MSDVYRESALLLHSVDPASRSWVLMQLPDRERALLSDYVGELKSLGIPADPMLADGVLADAARVAMPLPRLPRDALRLAEGDALLQILLREPDWLIAAVMSIEAWPWREAVFAGLDASKRERVRQALRPQLPAALASSLCAGLAARLSVTNPAPPMRLRTLGWRAVVRDVWNRGRIWS
jgi:hypothetical protein